MVYITIYQWLDDYLHFIEGEYWGMVGGDSNTAKIVRCTKDKVRLEQHSIDEYETVMFSTRHNVKITHSNGRTCNMYVSSPVPLEKPKNLLPSSEQTVSEGNVTLSWDMVSEAGTKYYITINNNANPWCDPPIEECSNPEYPNCTKYEGDYCGEVTTNSITLNLLPGFYSWWVQTIDQWGNLSEATFTNLTVIDPCEGITCKNTCIEMDLYSQKCLNGECTIEDLIEKNSIDCGYIPPDLCEGITCPDFCDGTIKYFDGQCLDEECIYEIEENSIECGYIPPCIPNWQCEIPLNGFEKDNCGNRRYNENCEPYIDPCEDVVCNNICVGTNLYSQKCINGLCVADQLLESNSLSCGYIPQEEPPIDEEPKPPSDLTKIIIPIGFGIGLLSLLKK